MLAKPNQLQQLTIEEVIKELGLPESAKFLGYAIHRPDTDEYVALAIENEYESRWAWSKVVKFAALYEDYPDAYAIARLYTKAPVIIGVIFDTETMIYFRTLTS
jgi:hypothetical protein